MDRGDLLLLIAATPARRRSPFRPTLDRFRIGTHPTEMTRRPMLGVGAVAVAVAFVLLYALATGGASSTAGPSASAGAGAGAIATLTMPPPPTLVPTPRPAPGHEVFGFVPYWEMDAGIAAHLANTDLTTLALFSVTHTKDGSLDTAQTGYKRISGAIGGQLIREAHQRGAAVQLVYSSLGAPKNNRLFGSGKIQAKAIAGLVALAKRLDVDGINVDVEGLGIDKVALYGAFVGRLRDALRVELPKAQVSVATTSGSAGAAMALAATTAGADRVFLMGYDYHYSGSDVGASAPLDRRDGADPDLAWSLNLYEAAGVPVQRTILGLPLYGMRWRVSGPELGAARIGNGAIWVPGDNPKLLANPPLPPELDPIELVEFYAIPPDPSLPPGDTSAAAGWQAIYVDSPSTIAAKLTLADERGLAGGGFWAIGYERGLPGYSDVIARFHTGKLP
jgi:hypothetical protein